MIGYNSEYIPHCIEYPPKVYSDIEEFKALAEAYNIECKLLMDEFKSIEDNSFIDTLDSHGCDRWEKILKLESNSNYTLEDRRFQIKVVLMGHRPYTLLRLKEMLNNLVGENNYILELNTAKNHLTCKVDLGVKYHQSAIDEMLEKMLPLDVTFKVELLYNLHEMLSQYTHEYLSQFTHQYMKEEVFK